MNDSAKRLQLTDFRRWFGQFIPEDSVNGFIEVRRGRHIKFYGAHVPRGRWVYRPKVMRAYGKRRPLGEIAAFINKRSLDEVRDQADDAIKQLIYRSHVGNKRAIALLVGTIRKSILSLEQVEKAQREKLQAEAETSPVWPVLLSLNPQEIRSAKELLRRLRVGLEAPTPTRPGQRIDFRNFWTVLAREAFEVCQLNVRVVAELLACGRPARRERKVSKFWGTDVSATFYYPSGSEVIIVADWQATCARLREPVTKDNVETWWKAVKGCIWEYWHNHVGEYRKALMQIGRANEEESRRRNLAMTQVNQAFRSLVGLRLQARRGTVRQRA